MASRRGTDHEALLAQQAVLAEFGEFALRSDDLDPILGADGRPPYGILEVDSREPRRFTGTDTDFLRTYANLLAEAIERVRVLRELRSAVADKERLLRELQHRVKNNLQTVTSLVRLQ